MTATNPEAATASAEDLIDALRLVRGLIAASAPDPAMLGHTSRRPPPAPPPTAQPSFRVPALSLHEASTGLCSQHATDAGSQPWLSVPWVAAVAASLCPRRGRHAPRDGCAGAVSDRAGPGLSG